MFLPFPGGTGEEADRPIAAVSAAFFVSQVNMKKGVLTGIFSMSLRLMPIVIVVVLLGQDPHAPWSLRYTTGPSISESSTFPPSDMRYGLICSHAKSEHARLQGTGTQLDSRACQMLRAHIACSPHLTQPLHFLKLTLVFLL